MPRGRPLTKFNPKRVGAILNEIKRGIPYVIAAEMHGIHECTFRDWRSNGRRDILAQVDSEYALLVRSLRQIEGERIANSLVDIRDSEKGHRGKEWELERSFWRYFSSKSAEIELNERVEELERQKGDNNAVSSEEEKE